MTVLLTKDQAGTLSCAAMVTLAGMKGDRAKVGDLLADLNDLWGGAEALVAALKCVAHQVPDFGGPTVGSS